MTDSVNSREYRSPVRDEQFYHLLVQERCWPPQTFGQWLAESCVDSSSPTPREP